MRLPMPPPDTLADFKTGPSPEAAERLVRVVMARVDPIQGGRYRHWDRLRYQIPPPDLSHEDWWMGVKMARGLLAREITLKDKRGRPFSISFVDILFPYLHEIDRSTSGTIKGGAIEEVINPETRATYLFKSLTEEAITSSQLEGAATTRRVAKEMIRTGRQPRDVNEKMILNNYEAMQFIQELKHDSLTTNLIYEIHRILTAGTLEDPDAAGRFRRADERIVVQNQEGKLLHDPPAAEELPKRIEALCAFANERDSVPYLHPVVRAILLHFWLAYDHPFVDGNGRTARALMYWAMAAQDYWLFEFISISRILNSAPSRYHRAFLYTESDENDTTYFVLNQLDVILRAVRDLHAFLRTSSEKRAATRASIEKSHRQSLGFNERQIALLGHARENPGHLYTIESHRTSHGISYGTARADLLSLHDAGLLDFEKHGKRFVFIAPEDLGVRLKSRRRAKSGTGRSRRA